MKKGILIITVFSWFWSFGFALGRNNFKVVLYLIPKLDIFHCTLPKQLSNVFFNLGYWVYLGKGCCPQGTLLFSGYFGNLDECKEKCLRFDNDCKYIVHGGSNGELTHCTIYNADYPCKQLDHGPHDCQYGGEDEVHSYEYIPGDIFFRF